MLSAALADAHNHDLLEASRTAQPVRSRPQPARRRARTLAARLRAR